MSFSSGSLIPNILDIAILKLLNRYWFIYTLQVLQKIISLISISTYSAWIFCLYDSLFTRLFRMIILHRSISIVFDILRPLWIFQKLISFYLWIRFSNSPCWQVSFMLEKSNPSASFAVIVNASCFLRKLLRLRLYLLWEFQ